MHACQDFSIFKKMHVQDLKLRVSEQIRVNQDTFSMLVLEEEFISYYGVGRSISGNKDKRKIAVAIIYDFSMFKMHLSLYIKL